MASRPEHSGIKPGSRARVAFTLVEVLLVVTLMIVLMSIAASSLRRGLRDRKLRETSRTINAVVARVKARAAQTGRNVGIWLERGEVPLTDDPTTINASTNPTGNSFNYCQQLFIAETPPPYSGDVVGALARIQPLPTGTPVGQAPNFLNDATIPPLFFAADILVSDASALPSLAGAGDLIKFEYRGAEFPILADIVLAPTVPPNPPRYRVIFSVANQLNSLFRTVPPTAFYDAEFQVIRRPRRLASSVVNLPGGAIIDLSNSGQGDLGREFSRADRVPVVIMFSPTGRVVSVSGTNVSTAPVPPLESIHLLIGKRDQYDSDPTSPLPSAITGNNIGFNQNLPDLSTLWVSIGFQTGLVTSTNNTWNAAAGNFEAAMRESRSLTLEKQNLGGN